MAGTQRFLAIVRRDIHARELAVAGPQGHHGGAALWAATCDITCGRRCRRIRTRRHSRAATEDKPPSPRRVRSHRGQTASADLILASCTRGGDDRNSGAFTNEVALILAKEVHSDCQASSSLEPTPSSLELCLGRHSPPWFWFARRSGGLHFLARPFRCAI